jgi:hypothetical protein
MYFLVKSLALLAIAAPILAVPIENGNLEERVPQSPPGQPLNNLKMPQNTLPAPPSGLKLKWIGLGIGTQNYTCKDSTANTVPASNGAVAELYDISSLNNDPFRDFRIKTLPGMALGASLFGSDAVKMMMLMNGFDRTLGNHLFNSSLTPCFFLSQIKPAPGPELFAKKIANMTAPATSCSGTKGEGAVDWLFLQDVGDSIGGVKAVYRIETAGGKAPATCDKQNPTITVPYAAEYWFYGS